MSIDNAGNIVNDELDAVVRYLTKRAEDAEARASAATFLTLRTRFRGEAIAFWEAAEVIKRREYRA